MRFSGQQRQRGALAGLDGPVALCADALSLRDERLASLLYPALHAVAGGAVEQSGSLGLAQILWDSRRTLPLPGHPARSLFSRLCVRLLWDSSEPHGRNFSSVNG